MRLALSVVGALAGLALLVVVVLGMGSTPTTTQAAAPDPAHTAAVTTTPADGGDVVKMGDSCGL